MFQVIPEYDLIQKICMFTYIRNIVLKFIYKMVTPSIHWTGSGVSPVMKTLHLHLWLHVGELERNHYNISLPFDP